MSRRQVFLKNSLCPWCPLWLPFFFVFVVVPEVQAQTLRQRMLAAEDGRVATPAAIAPLLQGLRSPDWALVAQAVRGLGRFERPEFVVHIQPLVSVSRPEVRREAANALGQSLAAARREDPARPELALVTRALLARLRIEPDAATRGVITETLGRLPHRTADAVAEVETALRGLLPTPDAQPPVAMRGVVRGLDFLIRGSQKLRVPDPLTGDRLRAVATFGSDPADVEFALVRRGAWLAMLGAAGPGAGPGAGTGAGVDGALIERGLDDPDVQVRRLATTAVATMEVTDADRAQLLRRALVDASFNVRYEAVRSYARTLRAQDCAPLIGAADDANAHVALAALDALGDGCPGGPSPVQLLSATAATLPAPVAGQRPGAGGRSVAWHRPAHALVALARVTPAEATPQLARFAEHPVWEVRAYAARAAAAMSAAARLDQLAGDEHDNVRAAALAGLRQTRGHDADPVFVAALGRRDYELVLNAAQALEGSPRADLAVPALLAAFTRISAERRDTSRDTRMALLTRLRELGAAANAAGIATALEPCLGDADRLVAGACAALIRDWTGRRTGATPEAGPPTPLPQVLPTTARIAMAGGTIELRLFPGEAPFTVARFAALARRGYYNGLTMHRVVPGFVLQGGSPGANEYSGAAAFMRDELGLRSNARGTLGTSTRGRDTGDAQFFVNLLDNPRLDHDFTVFAEITSGLDVMDRVLEGDVIQSIETR